MVFANPRRITCPTRSGTVHGDLNEAGFPAAPTRLPAGRSELPRKEEARNDWDGPRCSQSVSHTDFCSCIRSASGLGGTILDPVPCITSAGNFVPRGPWRCLQAVVMARAPCGPAPHSTGPTWRTFSGEAAVGSSPMREGIGPPPNPDRGFAKIFAGSPPGKTKSPSEVAILPPPIVPGGGYGFGAA